MIGTRPFGLALALMLGAGGLAAQQDNITVQELSPAQLLELPAPRQQPDEIVREEHTIAATEAQGAILRGLDKVNGQTRDIELPNGGTAEVFGLDVAMSDCRVPADNPTGDAYAHLTIWNRGQAQAIFEGWMIASSPALNALDHNRYDIWVLRCITS